RARPILLRLLEALLAEPRARFSKERLFVEVWRLPYRAAREAVVHKAVDRLARLLNPAEPKRFVTWDARGRLVLRASRPCLVRKGKGAVLNPRERWLVRELSKRRAISNREYRTLLAIPRATARRDLEHLVSLGVLSRTGQGRTLVYRLVERSTLPPKATPS